MTQTFHVSEVGFPSEAFHWIAGVLVPQENCQTIGETDRDRRAYAESQNSLRSQNKVGLQKGYHPYLTLYPFLLTRSGFLYKSALSFQRMSTHCHLTRKGKESKLSNHITTAVSPHKARSKHNHNNCKWFHKGSQRVSNRQRPN